MTKEEKAVFARILAKNLKRIANENGKTQADMVRDFKISQSTISSWMTGARMPRMDKIEEMCRYFNCSRSDLLEETHEDAQAVMNAYRAADKMTQEMVRRILGVKGPQKSPDLTAIRPGPGKERHL